MASTKVDVLLLRYGAGSEIVVGTLQVPRNTMCIVNLGQHSVKCHTKDSAGQHQLNYVCVGLVSLARG